MFLRAAISIFILFHLSSCNESDISSVNSYVNYPGFSIVYDRYGTLDSVYCRGNFLNNGSLGNIDLSDGDSVAITFEISVSNSTLSQFSIYYIDGINSLDILNQQFSYQNGTFYGNYILTSINQNRSFFYKMSIGSTEQDCYFVVKNLRIMKKSSN